MLTYCNSRRNRKVSKYRDKDGKINKQVEECLLWCDKNSNKMEFWEKFFKSRFLEDSQKRKKSKHKVMVIKSGEYISSFYKKVIEENRFKIVKLKKEDNICIYPRYEMSRFILVLIYAYNNGKMREFIDVPDVFFVLRQLKETGIEIYI